MDEKELMELMQELKKIKEENVKIITSLQPSNNKPQPQNQINTLNIPKQKNIETNKLNGLVELRNEIKYLFEILKNMENIIEGEFNLIKKENEITSKAQKIFAQSLITLIEQNKTLLKEYDNLKKEIVDIKNIITNKNERDTKINVKLLDLLVINKNINENLLEKINKLEKKLLLIMKEIEGFKIFLASK